MTDVTYFSLLSALNPCNTALHSIGTFLVLSFVPSPWLFSESVVSFSTALILVSRSANFFFNFGADMFLQSFNLFVCLQVTFMQSFIDSFDEFFEFSISCVTVVGYFGERLRCFVHIDFDFFHVELYGCH